MESPNSLLLAVLNAALHTKQGYMSNVDPDAEGRRHLRTGLGDGQLACW